MAKHPVKCFYCGQIFDSNSEPFMKPRTNRYAHVACHEKYDANKSQEERDYDMLIDYIKHLFGPNPNPRIWKQLKEYKTVNNYSYSGILKTLQWWYEIQHHDIDQSNGGIGIVPYIYDQACKYYYALYLAAVANEDKDVEHFQVKVKEFSIEPPVRIVKPPRLFNLDDLEEEE